jgi:hypothetical protein
MADELCRRQGFDETVKRMTAWASISSRSGIALSPEAAACRGDSGMAGVLDRLEPEMHTQTSRRRGDLNPFAGPRSKNFNKWRLPHLA